VIQQTYRNKRKIWLKKIFFGGFLENAGKNGYNAGNVKPVPAIYGTMPEIRPACKYLQLFTTTEKSLFKTEELY